MSARASQNLVLRFLTRERRRLRRPARPQRVSPAAVTTRISANSAPSTSASTSSASSLPSTSSVQHTAGRRGRTTTLSRMVGLTKGMDWNASNSPFASLRLPVRESNSSITGPVRPRYARPVYSARRQKELAKAAQRVVATSSSGGKAKSTSPMQWDQLLPSSRIIEQLKRRATESVIPRTPRHRNAAVPPPSLPPTPVIGRRTTLRASRLAHRGPYSGRTSRGQPAFRGHQWERELEQTQKERARKLETMPARIAEYVKNRAATRAAAKPSLPF